MSEEIKRAEIAANRIISEFSDTVAIDTADYQLCAFIMGAARVASQNAEFARKIGALMEDKRKA